MTAIQRKKPSLLTARDRGRDSGARSLSSPTEMRRPAYRALYWFVFVCLFLLTLTTIIPLYWMFIGPLKTPVEFLKPPPTFWPKDPQWHTYPKAWSNFNYLLFFKNTILIAIGTLFFRLFVTTTASYALSKLRPVGRKLMLVLFFSTMAVPFATLLIPRYLAVVRPPVLYELTGIQLIESWWAIWLPYAADGGSIFIVTLFFDHQIPDELIDAARIDGASSWRVFTQIVLPLAKAILAVLTIGSIMGSWQDFFWPFLVLQNNTSKWPIMVRLYGLSKTAYGPQELNVVLAGIAIAAIPPLIFFMLFQRQIVRGLSQAGLTGI